MANPPKIHILRKSGQSYHCGRAASQHLESTFANLEEVLARVEREGVDCPLCQLCVERMQKSEPIKRTAASFTQVKGKYS